MEYFTKGIKLKNGDEFVCELTPYNKDLYQIRNPIIVEVYFEENYVVRVEKYIKHYLFDRLLFVPKDEILFEYQISNELALYYHKTLKNVKKSDSNVKLLLSSVSNEAPMHDGVLH